MLLASLICLALGISISPAAANVEKTIFLGPEPVNIPSQQPSLSALNIDTLTPDDDNWSLRTHIDASFPTQDSSRGSSSWFILDGLAEGRRYEVRICWLATQPTAFRLETHTLPEVFDTPELITSLHNYSTSRRGEPTTTRRPYQDGTTGDGHGDRLSSVLFLRVDAAADYFTTDAALMRRPEPVLADLILDPFVLNVLPRTLAPAAGLAVLAAALSWALASRVIMPRVRGLMVAEDGDGDGDGDGGRPQQGGEQKKTR
ncbi:hypothetical protein KVR01_005907 [Diaporthe batatas]|uniref:uncharacterized protein n=1 Tax=Diaporthe batatas TaxID=748121 RepID=UPI001D050109|nr:uncharacterized protein KVR01_005907 [Diaporthe batatas]KAG8163989.1 hypothetical protein KVR01_005907 [Diaporthe batatas]